MGKQSLLKALQFRDGSETAIIPRIQRHAAAIEQIPEIAVWADPEAIARSLRNIQNLYSLDAVTLGDSSTISVGCRQASTPGLGPLEALVQNEEQTPLLELPSPESVVTSPVLNVYLEACRRIQTVLGQRAGIAIVVPDDQALQNQLALHNQSEWAHEVLIHVVRAFGPLEPDLFMFVGDAQEIPARLRPIVNYFGSSIVHISTSYTEPGIRYLLGDLRDDTQKPWLVTTNEEIEADMNPSELSERLLQARQQEGQKA